MKNNTLVFDVESTALHGEGFAVGAAVFDGNSNEIDNFELLSIEGATNANDWVRKNVLPNCSLMPTCDTNRQLREKFYEWLMKHAETCVVYSDVNFPVETNFLSTIVSDSPVEREYKMPYPLLDISAWVDIDIDRMQFAKTGYKKHNPMDDARCSYFAMLKARQGIL